MNRCSYTKLQFAMISALAACLFVPIIGSAGDASDQIADALSAAWPGMAENAAVVDWDGNVLREGLTGYTCMPRPPGLEDKAPMCMEGGHLMILAPAELLEAFPSDPNNGGPYVMWKGTPYAHLMVPIGSRD